MGPPPVGGEDRIHLDQFEIDADLPGIPQQRYRLCGSALRHPNAGPDTVDLDLRIGMVRGVGSPATLLGDRIGFFKIAKFEQSIGQEGPQHHAGQARPPRALVIELRRLNPPGISGASPRFSRTCRFRDGQLRWR